MRGPGDTHVVGAVTWSRWGQSGRDLRRPWTPGEWRCAGYCAMREKKTKDFSCNSTTQVSISTEIRDAGEGPGEVGNLLLGALRSQHHPFLEHSTATLQRGAMRRNLRNCVIHLKVVCSYCSWWKILGWVESILYLRISKGGGRWGKGLTTEKVYFPSMSICEYGVSKLVALWEFNKCVNSSFLLCDFLNYGAISTEVWQCSLATHLPLLLGIVYSLHKSARKGHGKGKNPKMTSSLFLSKEMIMLKVEQNHRKSWTQKYFW